MYSKVMNKGKGDISIRLIALREDTQSKIYASMQANASLRAKVNVRRRQYPGS
jgi:hypothetical protein